MGSNPHARLVPLNGHTPAEAWNAVSDEEGWENGHSYSGDFGSKGGMVLVVHDARLTKEMVALAGVIMERVNEEDFDFGKVTPEEQAVINIIPPVKFMQANDVYDDKWADAVGFAGKDWAWFGGWCPS